MEQLFDEKTIRRIYVLLSVQNALVGAITSHLRAVKLFWDMHRIDIYFIYDGEISEDDQEESECAATEILADFPDDHVAAHHIRCDFPNRMPELGNEIIFRRKEVFP